MSLHEVDEVGVHLGKRDALVTIEQIGSIVLIIVRRRPDFDGFGRHSQTAERYGRRNIPKATKLKIELNANIIVNIHIIRYLPGVRGRP